MTDIEFIEIEPFLLDKATIGYWRTIKIKG